MILLVGGEKGGTGKSTIAINLAVEAARAGHSVLIVDADPQGTATNWVKLRKLEHPTLPAIESVAIVGNSFLKELKPYIDKYDQIIIDAGGRDSVELRLALPIVQRAVIPIRPSQADVWTVAKMDILVAEAQGLNQDLQAAFVINCALSNTTRKTMEAKNYFSEYVKMPLCETTMISRVVYMDAIEAGLGVTEMPRGKAGEAAGEVQLLYQEVFNESPVPASAAA